MRILKESLTPEVGPFYVIDGAVFADSESYKEVFPNNLGFIDSNNNHYDYWHSLQRFYPEFRRLDYDYYPRGRVIYNSKEKKFHLYADQCILDDESLIDAIIEELSLPAASTIVGDDEHYQCHNCNPDYLKIAENYSGDLE